MTLAVMAFTLIAVGGGVRWVHIGLNRSRTAALAMTAGQIIAAGLMILLVHGPGYVARVPAFQLVGEGLAAILLLWWLGPSGRRLPVELRWSVVRPLVSRASALVVSALLGIVIYSAGFIFLRVFKGDAAVGYYTAAYTLVTFFLNLGTAYSMSLLPSLTRLGSARGEQHRLYHDAMAHVFAAGLPAAIGGSILAAPIIGLLFGPGFAPASLPLGLLVWCIPLCLLRDVPLMALQAGGKEGRVLRITVGAAGLGLALNAVLIPRWGIAGAAVATVATEAVRLGLALVFLRREGYALTGLSRFWRSLVAGGAMAGLLLTVGPDSIWLAIPLGALGYLAVLTVLGGLRFRKGALPALTV